MLSVVGSCLFVCFVCCPHCVCRFLVKSLFCDVVLYLLSCLASIILEKRERACGLDYCMCACGCECGFYFLSDKGTH